MENATAPDRPALGMQGRLTRVCGPGFARPGGAADEVARVPARWVAAPGTVSGAVELLRLAAEHDLAVVPRGAGTKIDWGGAPSRVDLVLDTGRLAWITHPADPGTVEVGAGTPLRAVQAALARTGRRLALDPPSAEATVGGVIAADEAGPLRHRYGGPADQVRALRVLDAYGASAEIVRGADGSAVRQFCGSRGTLGLLTSATLRVRAAPASRIWVSHPVWTPLEMHDLVQGARVEAVEPAAVEVDLPAVPPRGQVRSRAATPGAGTLAILLEGGPADVLERANWLVDSFGGDAHATHRPPAWWGRHPAAEGEIAVRIEAPVGELHAVVYALRDAVGAPVAVRGSAGLGSVRAALPGDLSPARAVAILTALRGVLLARRGRCEVLAAPPRLWQVTELHGHRTHRPRSVALKRHVDPEQRFAPGRLPDRD